MSGGFFTRLFNTSPPTADPVHIASASSRTPSQTQGRNIYSGDPSVHLPSHNLTAQQLWERAELHHAPEQQEALKQHIMELHHHTDAATRHKLQVYQYASPASPHMWNPRASVHTDTGVFTAENLLNDHIQVHQENHTPLTAEKMEEVKRIIMQHANPVPGAPVPPAATASSLIAQHGVITPQQLAASMGAGIQGNTVRNEQLVKYVASDAKGFLEYVHQFLVHYYAGQEIVQTLRRKALGSEQAGIEIFGHLDIADAVRFLERKVKAFQHQATRLALLNGLHGQPDAETEARQLVTKGVNMRKTSVPKAWTEIKSYAEHLTAMEQAIHKLAAEIEKGPSSPTTRELIQALNDLLRILQKFNEVHSMVNHVLQAKNFPREYRQLRREEEWKTRGHEPGVDLSHFHRVPSSREASTPSAVPPNASPLAQLRQDTLGAANPQALLGASATRSLSSARSATEGDASHQRLLRKLEKNMNNYKVGDKSTEDPLFDTWSQVLALLRQNGNNFHVFLTELGINVSAQEAERLKQKLQAAENAPRDENWDRYLAFITDLVKAPRA